MVKILDEYVDGFGIMHLRMEHGVNRLLDDALHGLGVEGSFLDAWACAATFNRSALRIVIIFSICMQKTSRWPLCMCK